MKLYFAEPDRLEVGKRVFDVSLQGKEVLTNFDIAKEAGGASRSVIRWNLRDDDRQDKKRQFRNDAMPVTGVLSRIRADTALFRS